MLFDDVIDPFKATPRERFEAMARSLRDVISQRWLLTERIYEQKNPKRVYYLSMEFLLGRSLMNNAINARLAEVAFELIKGKRNVDPALPDSAGGADRDGHGARDDSANTHRVLGPDGDLHHGRADGGRVPDDLLPAGAVCGVVQGRARGSSNACACTCTGTCKLSGWHRDGTPPPCRDRDARLALATCPSKRDRRRRCEPVLVGHPGFWCTSRQT
jgi:hypothetical protein